MTRQGLIVSVVSSPTFYKSFRCRRFVVDVSSDSGVGMSSEARVHGVLSKAQSRDQPISQSFSQSALDRSDLPCQVMAEKAPEEARNHLCGLQISRVACEAKQDAEGARLRRGSRRLSSLCYDCASCKYVEVICLPSCKSLKDCPCTGEPISNCSMLGCSRLN